MPHHTPLIATIVAGLTLAFALGALAQRFKISPLVGYLLAGVAVGPFTPGYVADQALARELAEIGVILLMFGVGLHFSLKDLLAVRAIAIPGALGQMAVATLLGMGLGHQLGWPPISGFVFGLALSVASTVVLLRALQERRILQTDRGRIAVGWLIVEDLAMVLALVLLPALAGALTPSVGPPDIVATWIKPLALTVVKVSAFVALMLVVGGRVIPWLLHYVAHTGSRELFRLGVLAIALGVAFGASLLFDVSFALGAFFAGMILAESELSHRAAEETLPLRDAFAVLFFVSVGMLFNPLVVFSDPWPLLATVAIIVIGKSLAALAMVRMFKHDSGTALTIAASLAQIGEFSFILAGLGVGLKILPEQGRDLILGGAIISILLNPLLFTLITGVARKRARAALDPPQARAGDPPPTTLTEHVILVGFGRVGAAVAEGLETAERPFIVLEGDERKLASSRRAGFETCEGNATDPQVLAAAGIATAQCVIVTIPDGFEAGGVVQAARRCNPDIDIIARAHSDAAVAHLMGLGADETILGERETAKALVDHVRTQAVARSDATTEPTQVGDAAILSDPEWALLAGVRSTCSMPADVVSKAVLLAGAERYGAFEDRRLEEALRSLIDNGNLIEVDPQRVAVTAAGYDAAMRAPHY
jgi:CPA2 family monovalent cation:H+ antiporter-2